MRRVRIGLLCLEPEYIRRASAYIRVSEYRERVRPAFFTDAGSCLAALGSRPEGLDVLLADERVYTREVEAACRSAGCPVLLLGGDGLGDSGPSGASLPAVEPGEELQRISMFRPLNELLDRAHELAEEREGTLRAEGDGAVPIWTVYSAVGGCGKSVFAYVASELLPKLGLRPIVVSLETVASPWWRSEANKESDRFERALYEVTKEAPSPTRLASLLEGEPSGRGYGLPPPATSAELAEMSGELTERLLQGLAACGKGDVVLVDLETGRHPRTEAALQISQRTFFLVPDHAVGCVKSLPELEAAAGAAPVGRSRRSVLFTLCSGAPRSPLSGRFDAEEALPFVPEWVNLDGAPALNGPSAYRDRLHRYLSRLPELGRLRGGRSG